MNMKNHYLKCNIVTALFLVTCIALSMITYAKKPTPNQVHMAYVEYIKNNYMPYYKTGRKKIDNTPYGTSEYEYLDLKATEVDINEDGIKELVISSWSGGVRGSYTLLLYRNGKVVDTHIGGTNGVTIYRKRAYFHWSNGASNSGITKVKIGKKGKTIKTTKYEFDNAVYKVNDIIVNKDQYEKSLSLPSDPTPAYLEFTDIEQYIV